MSVIKITFLKDHFPNQGAGYTGQEEAAFPIAQAVELVAKKIARFSDPADLETHREAVEIAKRSKPTQFVRRLVPADPRRWG
jgi:hypothetical protein